MTLGKVLKGVTIFLATLVVLCFICAASAQLAWLHFSSAVDTQEEAKEEKICVERGTTARQMAEELEDKGLLRSANLFCLALRLKLFDDEPFVLKSGFYEMNSSMTMEEIYHLLQSGHQEYVRLTVPEGLTLSKVASVLDENGVCQADDFLTVCRDQTLLDQRKIPAASFEGYLFPDTYFFLPETDAKDVLDVMVDNFFSKIASITSNIGIKEIDETGKLSAQKLHEIVILASIVEREYRVKEEAPLIASVFSNRLRDGIGLYSCATIEYVLTEIQGKSHPDRITYEDLEVDSPYNTYKWAGLPPGPISNPGMTSLEAAVAPAKTNYYFFVLSDPKSGRHTFSETFNQHKRAENAVLIPKGSGF